MRIKWQSHLTRSSFGRLRTSPYRQLTASLSSGLTIDGECKRLALSYLNALEDLEQHLQTLDDSDEVRDMKASNARSIELIREDLKKFELTPA